MLVGCGVSVGLRLVGVGVADGSGVPVPVGVELRTSVGVSVFKGEFVTVQELMIELSLAIGTDFPILLSQSLQSLLVEYKKEE